MIGRDYRESNGVLADSAIPESAAPMERGTGMDGLRGFLDQIKRQGLADGLFLGLLHILIGHAIQAQSGQLISNGLTWRVVAELLKKVRWDKSAVLELGINPKELPPRDRERFWYQAIQRAQVDSEEARRQAAELAVLLSKLGCQIS